MSKISATIEKKLEEAKISEEKNISDLLKRLSEKNVLVKYSLQKTEQIEIKKEVQENEYEKEKNRMKFPDLTLVFIEQKENLEESRKAENLPTEWKQKTLRGSKFGGLKQKNVHYGKDNNPKVIKLF